MPPATVLASRRLLEELREAPIETRSCAPVLDAMSAGKLNDKQARILCKFVLCAVWINEHPVDLEAAREALAAGTFRAPPQVPPRRPSAAWLAFVTEMFGGEPPPRWPVGSWEVWGGVGFSFCV